MNGQPIYGCRAIAQPPLTANSMPASIAFYRDVLGFEIATTSQPEVRMLRLGTALTRRDRTDAQYRL